ncbi:hypothetical protein [Streptomyces sp. NPDC127112]|uniref:hypothetical protein n=1 Tax=Streptomyces sp. NPDC127112 TaxID=3345364 RepID=UPI00362655E6
MSTEVFDGSSWASVKTFEVFDSSKWVTATSVERWNGSAWDVMYKAGPNAPTDVTAKHSNPYEPEFTVTWSPYPGATTYVVESRFSRGREVSRQPSDWFVQDTTQPSFTFSKMRTHRGTKRFFLCNEDVFEFRVKAVTASGESSYSATATAAIAHRPVTPGPTIPVLPEAIEQLDTNKAHLSFKVSWKPGEINETAGWPSRDDFTIYNYTHFTMPVTVYVHEAEVVGDDVASAVITLTPAQGEDIGKSGNYTFAHSPNNAQGWGPPYNLSPNPMMVTVDGT